MSGERGCPTPQQRAYRYAQRYRGWIRPHRWRDLTEFDIEAAYFAGYRAAQKDAKS